LIQFEAGCCGIIGIIHDTQSESRLTGVQVLNLGRLFKSDCPGVIALSLARCVISCYISY
jgi:hypothetical protein